MNLHPTERTYLFVAHYTKAYQYISRMTYDYERAEHTTGLKIPDLFAGKETTAFWKARQNADRLCIPYDFYTREVMRFAISNIWKRIPRPTHMYSAKLTEHMIEAWERECRACIRLPSIEHYQMSKFQKEENQLRFIVWLAKQIMKRQIKVYLLSDYIKEKNILSDKIARLYFGELVDEALDLSL